MANTNTQSLSATLDHALSGVPKRYRERLIASYVSLKRGCAESRHESAGLAAGKFCEIALRLLQERVLGAGLPFTTKIQNFADECRKIVTAQNPSATESEHTILPRALVFLYTMRNKRGIGHIGGDVDANATDVMLMARVADWFICELVRIHHGMSLEEAQDLVDALTVRQIPHIWEVGGKKRVLRDGLKAKDEVLLLLYSSVESVVMLEDLTAWVEYSNPSVFKRSVLTPLHKARMVEWDKDSDTVTLSPKGAAHVEASLL